jgi:hypothetical protein
MNRPNCSAFTAKGVQCSARSLFVYDEFSLCGKHIKKYAPHLEEHGIEGTGNIINHDNAESARKKERRERLALMRMARNMNEQEMRMQQEINIVNEIVEEAIQRRVEEIQNQIIRENPPNNRVRVKPVGALQKFVNDKQNVHTSAAVKQTTDIIERILKIEVPNGYNWNMRRCSKTPGEIIAYCRLSIDASRTMMDKYTMNDDIYDLGKGIYGRLLDCVWQYIRNSDDKKVLYKTLKTELEDNIGMCQQGNLSRLANILAGYLEGVGSTESVSEILGREFPKLWDIEDENERVEAGNKILNRLSVTEKDVRDNWIAALY